MHTNVEAELEQRGVERALITGVMSDTCCDTTARSAFVRGYETWSISDACFTDTQERHQQAVDGIEITLGRVCTAADAIAALNEEKLRVLPSNSPSADREHSDGGVRQQCYTWQGPKRKWMQGSWASAYEP